jgi:PAS domain S-box-containing protein
MLNDDGIVDELPVGIYRTTPEGTFLDVNETMVEILDGSSKAEVLEHGPAEFYVDAAERESFLETLRSDGRVSQREVELRTFDGARLWITTTAVLDESDEETYIEGVIQDISERKRAETELEKREQRLTELTESTDDVLWMFSADWNELLFVNSAYEDIWGKSVETLEADPRTFLDGVHPEDRERVMEVMGTVSAGEPKDLEFRVNGDEDFGRWVWVQAQPIRDETGEVVRVAGFSRDVTERKEQEQEIRATRKRFQTLLETAPDAILAADAETGEIVEANDAATELLGYAHEELLGMPQPHLHPRADDGRYRKLFERHAQGAETTSISKFDDGSWVFVETADGDRIPVEINARTVELDDQRLVYGILRDVSERKRTEERFETLNEGSVELAGADSMADAFRLAVETVEAGLQQPFAAAWRADEATGALAPVAVSAESDVGTDDELHTDAGGRLSEVFEAGDIVVPDDVDADLLGVDASLQSAILVPLDDYGLLAVGTREAAGFDDTDVHLVTVLTQQLTAVLHQLERERDLRTTKRNLERSNEQLQQFAYVASHDLQEPLRMISSYLELLEMEYGDELDGEALEYMEFAVDGAERMRNMINDLLQFSRVKTRAEEPERVDTDAIFGDVVKDLEVTVRESRAEITCEDLPDVHADPSQLKQVLQNLVSNAINYAGDDPPRIHVSAEVRDDDVAISVADEGIGIPEDQQERVFEIFTRGSRDDADGGTGIGLAICEQIVTRHGGEMWVDSEPGEGTTFTFTLPKPN